MDDRKQHTVINKTEIKLLLIILIFILSAKVLSQTNGLVLSGGGAKGLAHIGVIKALEENNIRIDYVAGTSMGAIIGALYVMGYTTDEMVELVTSDDFLRWSTGITERDLQFAYKKDASNAALINVSLTSNESKPVARIPSHMVSSNVMDFAIMKLAAGANAASNRNFDSLMVPFRCVAADIFNKEIVIFKDGNLAHAVRASITYPLYYEPIIIDSVLLFDGGLYNNFPFDVLIDDFAPDYIIGSKVANVPEKPGKNDLMLQMENMIMQTTNYEIPDSAGMVLELKLTNIGLLDFQKADTLIMAGYHNTIANIDKILDKAVLFSGDELKERREKFKSRIPYLKFGNIFIEGVGENQKEYIVNLISKKEKIISLEQVEKEYFSLVSEETIRNAYPEAVYNRENSSFDLLLNIKLQDTYKLSAGGLISLSTFNQAFVGFNYYSLSDIFNMFTGNLYLGRYYSSLKFSHRIVVPQKKTMLIDFTLTGNRWNYFSNEETSLFDTYSPSYIVRKESSLRTRIGLPAANNSLLSNEVAFSWIEDTYYQTKNFDENVKPDESEYFFATAKLIFENNNQNRKQYASRGNRFYGGLFYNAGFEYYTEGFIDTIGDQTREGNSLSWFAIKIQNENYSRIGEKFFMGTLIDITISNREYSENYTSTLINSYKFEPTPMSRQIFGSSLRNSSYLAAGIMPVFEITRDVNIKGGIYLYSPVYRVKDNNGIPEKGNLFEKIMGVGEVNIVYHTPVGPLSAGFNYFSDESKKMFYYLNFGYILFNKSGLD